MGPVAEGAKIRNVAFDSDVLVWFFRGNDRARRFIAAVPHAGRAVSSLTVMELLQGCRSRIEVQEVKAFLSANVPAVLHPDEAVSRRAIGLLEDYGIGHGLRVVDALIAATVIELGFTLATGNAKHYRAIASLDILKFRP